MEEHATAPRGRHAPPLEVRQDRQRARLFAAASAVFARTATPMPPRRRSPARPGCRRRRSTSTSPTRRSASSRCSTPRSTSSCAGIAQAAARPRRRRRRRARRRLGARVPRGHRRLPGPGADAAGGDHRRRPARRGAPRRRARRASPTYIDEPNRGDAERGRAAGSPRRTTRTRSSARSSSWPRASCAPACPGDIRELEPVVERLVLGLVGGIAARESGVSAASRRSSARSSPAARCPRLVAWREQVAREKRAAFRDGTTGAARSPGSATRPRACCCSGWRRPRTAPTAPGACSPATARATSCSPRCTAPASPTSRPPSPRRRPGAARLLDHRRGALRAAGQQAAAGGARALLGLARARAGAARGRRA